MAVLGSRWGLEQDVTGLLEVQKHVHLMASSTFFF